MTAREEERALVAQIEGHLLLAAAHEECRAAATRAADRLSWLTDSQRDDLERQFGAEYLELSRATWRRTAERGEELRREYEQRYRILRRRLMASFLLACTLWTAATLISLSA
ncbi:hypothetical protein ABZ642_07765 [Streptomyces sp. NPDC007157]|uniref:hypothetical protein n=1 Tax=Streptomyces sp. NPDC007157 TaxID=3154681 RepID=UPI0033D0AE8B